MKRSLGFLAALAVLVLAPSGAEARGYRGYSGGNIGGMPYSGQDMRAAGGNPIVAEQLAEQRMMRQYMQQMQKANQQYQKQVQQMQKMMNSPQYQQQMQQMQQQYQRQMAGSSTRRAAKKNRPTYQPKETGPWTTTTTPATTTTSTITTPSQP